MMYKAFDPRQDIDRLHETRKEEKEPHSLMSSYMV